MYVLDHTALPIAVVQAPPEGSGKDQLIALAAIKQREVDARKEAQVIVDAYNVAKLRRRDDEVCG